MYGKIQQITKSDGSTIVFTYDPAGNRISKTVTPSGGSAITTWYVRDAQGNILNIYTSGDATVNGGGLSLTESDIYGSSRLGMLWSAIDVYNPTPVTPVTMPLLGEGYGIIFTRGNKVFELTNHLGNVLATISDKKYGVSLDGSLVDHFIPQVVSANDYYPFGSQMPGRDTTLGGKYYRYGFNGKENDNEVKGAGDQQDYGMRIYDPRVGRFLSVDPLTEKYPSLTPYQFTSNSPLDGVDLDGKEWSPAGQNDGDPRDATAVQTMVDPKLIEGAKAIAAEIQRRNNEAVLMPDINGNGHIGPRAVVERQVAQIKQDHDNAIADNIRNGIGGSAGYLLGGDRGSYIGASVDQVVFSYTPGGVPDEHSSAFPNTPKTEDAMEIHTGEVANALSFKIDPAKYKYFYGEVTTGDLHNIQRSAQNLENLTTLGVTDINTMNEVIMTAFSKGNITSINTSKYGTTVMKTVVFGNRGSIGVGFFYKGGDMKATPSVSTIIPKIFKE